MHFFFRFGKNKALVCHITTGCHSLNQSTLFGQFLAIFFFDRHRARGLASGLISAGLLYPDYPTPSNRPRRHTPSPVSAKICQRLPKDISRLFAIMFVMKYHPLKLVFVAPSFHKFDRLYYLLVFFCPRVPRVPLLPLNLLPLPRVSRLLFHRETLKIVREL